MKNNCRCIISPSLENVTHISREFMFQSFTGNHTYLFCCRWYAGLLPLCNTSAERACVLPYTTLAFHTVRQMSEQAKTITQNSPPAFEPLQSTCSNVKTSRRSRLIRWQSRFVTI